VRFKKKFIILKGSMLFASLDIPLITLFMMAIMSLAFGTYCFIYGVGYKEKVGDHEITFGNSAVFMWFYVFFVCSFYLGRVIFYGHLFSVEIEKQENAIKRQLHAINTADLDNIIISNYIDPEYQFAKQCVSNIRENLIFKEMIPRVCCNIQFDKLLSRAIISAVASIFFSLFIFLIKYQV